jgi:hypothetical protein
VIQDGGGSQIETKDQFFSPYYEIRNEHNGVIARVYYYCGWAGGKAKGRRNTFLCALRSVQFFTPRGGGQSYVYIVIMLG